LENSSQVGFFFLGGGNSNIFQFSPRTLGKMNPYLTSVFFRWGLVNQPPTTVVFHWLVRCCWFVSGAGGRAFSSASSEGRAGQASSGGGGRGWRSRVVCGKTRLLVWKAQMDVSKNRATPKSMVYNGKPYKNGWFGGTTIFGNIQMNILQICTDFSRELEKVYPLKKRRVK